MSDKPFDFKSFAECVRTEAISYGRKSEKAVEEYFEKHPELKSAFDADRKSNPKQYTLLQGEVESILEQRRSAIGRKWISPSERIASAGTANNTFTWSQGFKTSAKLAVGPLSLIHDIVGYNNAKSDAEDSLTKSISQKVVPALSKAAVEEYGNIVAKLHLEKGATLGLSESLGFSDFLDWAKKYKLSNEAVIQLNPTSKTREQVEEALQMRGELMSQAGQKVQLAKAPDVRKEKGQGQGVA